jgi:hypothetical protein
MLEGSKIILNLGNKKCLIKPVVVARGEKVVKEKIVNI